VRFDLGALRFRLDVTPDGAKLVRADEDDNRPCPTFAMPPDDLVDLFSGRADLHVRRTRDEIALSAPDAEQALVAHALLARLIAAVAMPDELRGTVLEDIYRTMNPRVFMSAIPITSSRRLYEMVRELKPERTLEVGFANGISTLAIAYGLEHNGRGRHYANDPFQHEHYRDAGLKNLARAGLSERVTHLERPDYLELPKLLEQGLVFDLIFIDGCHFLDYTMVDFFYADRLLVPGGCLLIDDVHLEEVDHVVRFIAERRSESYELQGRRSSERLAVFQKIDDDRRSERGLRFVGKGQGLLA